MSDALEFNSSDPIEVPVKIGSDDYVLVEASGEAATKYRDAQIACTVLGPNGKVKGMKGIAELEPMLVSMCLHKVVNGVREPKTVPAERIKSWPARIQKGLFKKAKDISELTEAPDEELLLSQIKDALEENPELLPKIEAELQEFKDRLGE